MDVFGSRRVANEGVEDSQESTGLLLSSASLLILAPTLSRLDEVAPPPGKPTLVENQERLASLTNQILLAVVVGVYRLLTLLTCPLAVFNTHRCLH